MCLGLVNRCFIAYEFCCWWSMQTLTFIGKYLKEVVVPFVSVFWGCDRMRFGIFKSQNCFFICFCCHFMLSLDKIGGARYKK